MQFHAPFHPFYNAIPGLILGAIIGSFIAALAARWPQGRSVMAGRSHCEGCGKTLRAHELVPIISYVAQSGQCRTCGVCIGSDALLIELLAAAIGGLAFYVAPVWYGAACAIFGWLLLTLAWLDLRHFWLPNRLTAVLAITGGIAAYVLDRTYFIDHLIGGVAGFAVLALLSAGYRALRGRDGLGGGDAKMLGGIGLWTGWQALPFVLLGASMLGLLAAAVMILRGQAVDAATRLPLGALLAPAAFACWLAFALGR